MRQGFMINSIFRTAWLVPWSVPLRIRRWVARCYCYGGIHSGAAIAGTLWWIAFSMLLMIRFVRDKSYTLPIVITAYLILALLMTIILLAYPSLRSRYHNTFEITHRLLGWTSILLFWLQLLLLTSHTISFTKSSSDFGVGYRSCYSRCRRPVRGPGISGFRLVRCVLSCEQQWPTGRFSLRIHLCAGLPYSEPHSQRQARCACWRSQCDKPRG